MRVLELIYLKYMIVHTGTVTIKDASAATSWICDIILVITWYDPMSREMTLIEKLPSGADIFVNRNAVFWLLFTPRITTLANRFVRGLPVSKFWTVNLSREGVPVVGCTGIMLNIIFIFWSLSNQVLVPFVLSCADAIFGDNWPKIIIMITAKTFRRNGKRRLLLLQLNWYRTFHWAVPISLTIRWTSNYGLNYYTEWC